MMNARCGLADCNCEYTIGGLLRRLEMLLEALEELTPSDWSLNDPMSLKYGKAHDAAQQGKLTVEQTRTPYGATTEERTLEQEAKHRQLGAEALAEAQRDRDMFARDESLGRDKGVEESDTGERES